MVVPVLDEITSMIHLRKDTARQFSSHPVARLCLPARPAAATMTTPVIVAKPMCFLEGAA